RACAGCRPRTPGYSPRCCRSGPPASGCGCWGSLLAFPRSWLLAWPWRGCCWLHGRRAPGLPRTVRRRGPGDAAVVASSLARLPSGSAPGVLDQQLHGAAASPGVAVQPVDGLDGVGQGVGVVEPDGVQAQAVPLQEQLQVLVFQQALVQHAET